MTNGTGTLSGEQSAPVPRGQPMGRELKFVFAAAGLFLPRRRRSNGRTLQLPRSCPATFSPNCRGLSLRRPGDNVRRGLSIRLRSEAAKHSAQDEAEPFPSVWIISLFRHVPEHEAADVWKVRKVVPKAGTRYARCG